MQTNKQTPRFRTGLLGAGIQLSSSPAMHTDEARALAIDYSYELFDLDLLPGGLGGFGRVIEQAERDGFAGLNVTFPVKQQVIPLLHELSPEARVLHAVNTIVFRDGRRFGHNTDWWGFAESFKRGLPAAPLGRVALIGAGGAGAAVAFAILQLGAQTLCIHDLDTTRAVQLAERMQAAFPGRALQATGDIAAVMAGVDGIIHATPMGMAKLPGMAVPEALLHRQQWVAEVVYVPLETELLKAARRLGCATMDGGHMNVGQACRAFELFTGEKADIARMDAHFRRLVA